MKLRAVLAAAKKLKVRTVLTDAKKALGALAVMESSAVGFGVLDSAVAGAVAAGLGIATAAVVYLLANTNSGPPA